MRIVFTFLFLFLAFPALAQQEKECRGKQAFDLGDGAYGCLLDVGTSKIITTRTLDNGARPSTKDDVSGKIEVLMFGGYSGSKPTIGARLKTICRTFLPNLKAAVPDQKYHRITSVMKLPRVANPGDFVDKSVTEVAVQPAFSSGSCRGIRYFD